MTKNVFMDSFLRPFVKRALRINSIKRKKPRLGDTVLVKDGVIDPDYNIPIDRWCGRIIEIEDKKLIRIAWDSITLKSMPIHTIKKSEKKGLDWAEMVLSIEDVELSEKRDRLEDIEKVIDAIQWKYFRKDYF